MKKFYDKCFYIIHECDQPTDRQRQAAKDVKLVVEFTASAWCRAVKATVSTTALV